MLISTNTGLYSARSECNERYDMLNAVDFFHTAGFEALDVNFCGTIYVNHPKKPKETILDGDWERKVAAIAERAALYSMPTKLSHLPFFKYARDDIEDREFKMKMIYRSIEADALLSVQWTVEHMTADPTVAVEFLRPICEFATKRNVGIAVENVPTSTTEALIEAVDTLALEGYRVGVCLDVGHVNVAGLDQRETILKLGKRIKMLHLHDNYGKDTHQPPFCGTINWDDIITTLAEVGYEGDFNYEVNALPIPHECRMEHAKYLLSLARHFVALFNEKCN